MAKYVLHNGTRVLNVVESGPEWIAQYEPTAELLESEPAPSEGWIRNGAGDYSPPPKYESTVLAKKDLWEKIKAERDRRRSEGGTYVASVSRWFHSDDSSRIQQLGLVLLGANVPPVEWKTMDGTFITMSQQLAGAIFAAAAASDANLFATAEDARASMEIDPMTWDINSVQWPAIYEE